MDHPHGAECPVLVYAVDALSSSPQAGRARRPGVDDAETYVAASLLGAGDVARRAALTSSARSPARARRQLSVTLGSVH